MIYTHRKHKNYKLIILKSDQDNEYIHTMELTNKHYYFWLALDITILMYTKLHKHALNYYSITYNTLYE